MKNEQYFATWLVRLGRELLKAVKKVDLGSVKSDSSSGLVRVLGRGKNRVVDEVGLLGC